VFKSKVLLLSVSFLLIFAVPSQSAVKKPASKTVAKKPVSKKPVVKRVAVKPSVKPSPAPAKDWIDEGDSCDPAVVNTVKGYPKGSQITDWLKCDKKTKKYIRISYDPISSPSPSPTLIKNVSKSPAISDAKMFSPNENCRINDLSSRPGNSNLNSSGFPRPNGTFSGKSKATLLFLPISFSDQVFGDDDLKKMKRSFNEIQKFYKKTSYEKFDLNFEIPDKKNWVTIDGTAASYNLVKVAPQQNNTSLVEKIFQISSSELNFDKYDAVLLETKKFESNGGGQAFFGREFKTNHGAAKSVSFQFGNGAGDTNVISHELGHSLFGLEDLYLFNSSGSDPLPAGSWDLMSSTSATTFFGWNKYLNGWLSESDTDCVTNQNSITQYLEDLDSLSTSKKMILLNTAPGVLIAAEVRSATCNSKSCMGLLIYKINTNIHHGEGPISAQKLLLYAGDNLVIDKHRFTVDDSDNKGLLIRISK